MPLINVDATEVKLIEVDPRRKWVSFDNKTVGKDVYISDEPGISAIIYKWIIIKGERLIIDRVRGFPERAFYAVGDGSCQVAVGFQNDEEER